ncbi:MAG: hypothetical protein FWG87_13615 [Defluviitaleaceae bacterium]|nr:hypothetical protein [Defluviitaleaceae bacterium]
MGISDKLDYFAEAISEEIESKRRLAKHRAANELSKAAAARIEAAQERVSLSLDNIRQELARDSHKKIAAATQEARAAYYVLQSRLYEEIVEEVAERLRQFTQKEEYGVYLIKGIEGALPLSFEKVILCPQDMQLSQKIEEATGLAVVEGADFIGGFILSGENKELDCSFKARLENVKECEAWRLLYTA